MGILSDITQAFRMLFGGRTATEELPKDLSFKGQTILITGATTGLGFETAIHYLNLGAFRVIITARTKAKGEKAKKEIETRTGKKGTVDVLVLDMDTFEGVKSFVKELEKTVSRIDIVLLVSWLLTQPVVTTELTAKERRNSRL
jgi:NAD(P)-dependent dehydrogenase (short-subunit alcohol dehydrogenase family)